jgi:hypothetical protein
VKPEKARKSGFTPKPHALSRELSSTVVHTSCGCGYQETDLRMRELPRMLREIN